MVVVTDFLPVLALRRLGGRVPRAHPAAMPRAVLREPVGDGHDEPEETQTDTVHFGRDGDVGKESVVPAHENAATFKVFDDVEDLLALCLAHHPTYVEQGGDMLLPVGSRHAKRKKSTKVSTDAGSCGVGERRHHFGATLRSLRQRVCFWQSRIISLSVKTPPQRESREIPHFLHAPFPISHRWLRSLSLVPLSWLRLSLL